MKAKFVKEYVELIKDRHELTNEDVSEKLGINSLTLKSFMQNDGECTKACFVALKLWSDKSLERDGNEVIKYCIMSLNGQQERLLCDAWTAVGDDYLNYINEWSDKDLLEMVTTYKSFSYPEFFGDIIDAQLTDENGNDKFNELSEYARKAIHSIAAIEARLIAGEELASRFENEKLKS